MAVSRSFIIFLLMYFKLVTGKSEENSNEVKVPRTAHKREDFVFWPNAVIPFYIESEHFDNEQTLAIMKTLSVFSYKTCLKFAPVVERPKDNDHVLLFENPKGEKFCSIDTDGHSVDEPHSMILGYECLKSPKIEMMIMNALGFPFEHNRAIRDYYITVNSENVVPGYIELFTMESKLSPELRSLPYDINSVLHFSERDFTKNGHRTIIFKGAKTEQHRVGLSELDLRKIALIYGPECVKRDRQDKIQECQNYPGVTTEPSRKKREVDVVKKDVIAEKTFDVIYMNKSLRVNPDITPPPEQVGKIDNINEALQFLGIENEVQLVVDEVNKVSALALRRAREKYCNVTKTDLRTDDLKRKIDILDIVQSVADYAKIMVEHAVQNLTEFCETSQSLVIYQRAKCPFFEPNRCLKTNFRSTKSGLVQHSTQHRPIIKQSTKHLGSYSANKNQYDSIYSGASRTREDNKTSNATETGTRKKRGTNLDRRDADINTLDALYREDLYRSKRRVQNQDISAAVEEVNRWKREVESTSELPVLSSSDKVSEATEVKTTEATVTEARTTEATVSVTMTVAEPTTSPSSKSPDNETDVVERTDDGVAIARTQVNNKKSNESKPVEKNNTHTTVKSTSKPKPTKTKAHTVTSQNSSHSESHKAEREATTKVAPKKPKLLSGKAVSPVFKSNDHPKVTSKNHTDSKDHDSKHTKDSKDSKHTTKNVKNSKLRVKDAKRQKDAHKSDKTTKKVAITTSHSKDKVPKHTNDTKNVKHTTKDAKNSKLRVKDAKPKKDAQKSVKALKKGVANPVHSKDKGSEHAKDTKNVKHAAKDDKNAKLRAKKDKEHPKDTKNASKDAGNSKLRVKDVKKDTQKPVKTTKKSAGRVASKKPGNAPRPKQKNDNAPNERRSFSYRRFSASEEEDDSMTNSSEEDDYRRKLKTKRTFRIFRKHQENHGKKILRTTKSRENTAYSHGKKNVRPVKSKDNTEYSHSKKILRTATKSKDKNVKKILRSPEENTEYSHGKKILRSPVDSEENEYSHGKMIQRSPVDSEENTEYSHGKKILRSPVDSEENTEYSHGKKILRRPVDSEENTEYSHGKKIQRSPDESEDNTEYSHGKKIQRSPDDSEDNTEYSHGKKVLRRPVDSEENTEYSHGKKILRTPLEPEDNLEYSRQKQAREKERIFQNHGRVKQTKKWVKEYETTRYKSSRQEIFEKHKFGIAPAKRKTTTRHYDSNESKYSQSIEAKEKIYYEHQRHSTPRYSGENQHKPSHYEKRVPRKEDRTKDKELNPDEKRGKGIKYKLDTDVSEQDNILPPIPLQISEENTAMIKQQQKREKIQKILEANGQVPSAEDKSELSKLNTFSEENKQRDTYQDENRQKEIDRYNEERIKEEEIRLREEELKREEERLKEEELNGEREPEAENLNQEELDREKEAEAERLKEEDLEREKEAEAERLKEEELEREKEAEAERLKEEDLNKETEDREKEGEDIKLKETEVDNEREIETDIKEEESNKEKEAEAENEYEEKKKKKKDKKVIKLEEEEESFEREKQLEKDQEKQKEKPSGKDVLYYSPEEEDVNTAPAEKAEGFIPSIVPMSKQNKEFYRDRKWQDNIIRYIIKEDNTFDVKDVRVRLAEVNQVLKEKTCVELEEITEDDTSRFEDYLVLDSSPDFVTGRVGGRQIFGVVELLRGGQHRQHAAMMVMAMLGFYFEVSRHDRDEYIRVHMRHIRADKLHHFEKIRSDATFNLPYDYKSATHPAWQFWRHIGKTGISTVATYKEKDPDGSLMKSLGQNDELLSELDLVKINSVYGVGCFSDTRQ